MRLYNVVFNLDKHLSTCATSSATCNICVAKTRPKVRIPTFVFVLLETLFTRHYLCPSFAFNSDFVLISAAFSLHHSLQFHSFNTSISADFCWSIGSCISDIACSTSFCKLFSIFPISIAFLFEHGSTKSIHSFLGSSCWSHLSPSFFYFEVSTNRYSPFYLL